MTKFEFINILKGDLQQLDQADINENVQYYSELIDDMVEEGMTEAEAVEKLGDPHEAAKHILEDMPLSKLVKNKVKPKGGWTALTIILAVLSAPIWLPILCCVGAALLCVFIALWCMVAVGFAIVIALVLTVFSMPILAIGLMATTPALSLMLLGISFVCAGVGILGAIGVWELCKLIGRLTVKLVKWIKSLFIKKGEQ